MAQQRRASGFLQFLAELVPYPLAVEFRRRDWLDPEHADETLALLREAGLSYTMADEPQSAAERQPVYGVTNPKLAIVRFHGRNAANWYNFSGDGRDRFDWVYSKAELKEWLPNLKRALDEADRVHIFFNTNKDDQGPRNARALIEQLHLPMTDRD